MLNLFNKLEPASMQSQSARGKSSPNSSKWFLLCGYARNRLQESGSAGEVAKEGCAPQTLEAIDRPPAPVVTISLAGGSS